MVKINQKVILDKLPYSKPFLFVDELLEINENGVKGCYTFDAHLDFYKGHFKNNPITPGVILTETMAQIGVVCLGIYLLQKETMQGENQIFMTSTNVDFLKPVYPGEKITVISEKKYFRFNKLQCQVEMQNSKNEVVCNGLISGMFIHKSDEK
jgi:3-hydroxyacyl-[acyl-carrier-protein] dehydratase